MNPMQCGFSNHRQLEYLINSLSKLITQKLRFFLPIHLSSRRSIVVAFVCPAVHPSLRTSVNFTCPHDHIDLSWNHQICTKHASWDILSAGIENRCNWHGPSRSFWPFWLRIPGNSACPRDKGTVTCSVCPESAWVVTFFIGNVSTGVVTWSALRCGACGESGKKSCRRPAFKNCRSGRCG